jgi:hypothetical protein
MKRISLIILLVAIAAGTFAQKPSAESIRKRFGLSVTVFNDFWQNVPSESTDLRLINQGVDINALYNFPMDKKGHMFFFTGVGLGAHNFYHNAFMGTTDGTDSYFYKDHAAVNGHTIDVKKSKLSITYFDIPFGFQYKSSQKIHATLGFKVGWSINNHLKYKGTDYREESTGRTVKLKETGMPGIQKIHYGPYLTVGYKWVGLTAFYQITSIFEKDLGPQISPISVGITFRPF